jgi:toxin ParE1/3/4
LGQDFGQKLKRPELHPEANAEIGEALAHYRQEAPVYVVDDLDAKIESALTEIASHPERYSHWEGTPARKYVLPRFPYVIFYLNRTDGVQIVALAHTSRSPGYWKSRIAG